MDRIEGYKPAMAMIGLQCTYAVMALTTREAMLEGMSPTVFVVYRQAIATLVIVPIAYFCSWRKETTRCSMNFKSFWLIFVTSLIGVTINQNLYFEGIYLVSSSMASAMNNLIPAITFLIAFLLGGSGAERHDDSSETVSVLGEEGEVGGRDYSKVARRVIKSAVLSSMQVAEQRKGGTFIHPRKVYVRNVPTNSTKEELEDFFSPIGKIAEVHIPRAPNRAGKAFCFITFHEGVEIGRAIDRINGSKFRGLLLFAAQAKEKVARNVAPVTAKRPPESYRRMEDLRFHLKEKRFAVECKTFVRGKEDPILSALVRKAWMGVSNNLRSAELIQKELGDKGVFDIEVRDLGNRVVMLNCPDHAFERKMIEEDWVWLSSWITMVHGKEDCLSKGGYFRWICIRGIPIQGWNQENLEAIAERFGSSLMVHPESLSKFAFQKAFVLIHAPSNQRISEEISFMLGDDSYRVSVTEYEGNLIPPLMNVVPSSEAQDSGKETSEASDSSSASPIINEEDFNEGDSHINVAVEAQNPKEGLMSIEPGQFIAHIDHERVENAEIGLGNLTPSIDSEKTVSNILKFPKKKKKSGKTKGSKSKTLNSKATVSASDEVIAKHTYGISINDYEEALSICNSMGFKTKGKERLLREHLKPLNEVIDHWQSDNDADFCGDSEEDIDSSSGIRATVPNSK